MNALWMPTTLSKHLGELQKKERTSRLLPSAILYPINRSIKRFEYLHDYKVGMRNHEVEVSHRCNASSGQEAFDQREYDSHSSGSSVRGKPHRHAALHDFCMCIPYGIITSVLGFISFVRWGGASNVIVVLVGLAQLVLSKSSLKKWKSGESSVVMTAGSLCLAFLLAWRSWIALDMSGNSFMRILSLLLHSIASLFFVYNIAAGGNPPPVGNK